MKEEKLEQTSDLFLELLPILQYKINPLFHSGIQQNLKCNKNQSKALIIIGRWKEITPTLLGKYLDLRKGSLTTLIDSLVKMNLVKREFHPNDRRKTLIKLTSKGEELVELKFKDFKENINTLFDSFSDNQLENLNHNLLEIIKIVKKV
ncbi:MarR family transcriptional regulator [Gottschalkia purinilytica]|uniref:MarR family transcriptional regulator n=1 Tax=Gottschalkia purinilytica TaxID=1503 RepID=A0A0L0W8J9_GOTPU|nr:MarR family transcriptional regulator [Gottschalkia purinilytica]KNF07772.1 MarR family transcriptional regulator [Gottschalkia purinilytica]